MSNNLYNDFGPQQQNNDMMSKLNQFASQLKGDPKAMVQSLLNSGKMAQWQFNLAAQLYQQCFPNKKGGK